MVIEVKDISKTIENQFVLSHISLHLESGVIYGLKGKNGSGKTMLMRALCGLIRLTEGEIWIDNELLRRDISFPREVGVLIEAPGFIKNYSGYENLKALTSIKGNTSEQQIRETLQMVGLDPYDKKVFRKYSLGMKQKLGIAAAIIEKPELIILDEPTNALDETSLQNLKGILKSLKDEKKLIVISCHDTEELIQLSDEIIELRDGKVVAQWSTQSNKEIQQAKK